MTDVLLLLPPISFTNSLANTGHCQHHIGLAYLSAKLKREGISFRCINNANAAYGIDDILNICESERIKILGISSVTPAIRTSVELAARVKRSLGDRIHTMLGNAHIAADPSLLIRYPYFDSAIVGEADNMICEHVSRILQGEQMRGIFYADPPMELDFLPFPDMEAVENVLFKKGEMIPIIGTRGCPYKCGYCARTAMSKKVRTRSAQNILEEMLSRISFSRRFFFNDDSATLSRNLIKSLSLSIIEKKLKIEFQMITRLDLLDDEMTRLLKRSGCISILAGIESGNERIRNEIIEKALPDEKIYQGMSFSAKYKLPVQLFFMIGHPEETISEIMDSLNFPLKLEKMGFNNIEAVGYHITSPLPGTRYFEWCLQQGKILPTIIDDYIKDKLGDGFYGHWPYLLPDGLALDDVLKLRNFGTKSFFLRPRYILRRILQDIYRPRQILQDAKNAFYVFKQGTSSDFSKIES